MNWRYSTKEFDANKKISAADFQSLKDILRLSPSSTNIQPWHFVIADDETGKHVSQKVHKGCLTSMQPR
ncbi:nitroreductase family protein [Psychrobacter sp. JCM 18903]|uniref:nitroreductase family protein n=1 Tax=Psychrobacter sp. JCM 18903 TaxID=1298610 RepID=UPI0004B5CC85|nr:nitroreductase family protein [Psychrobacter sp. JCM 18903]